MSKIMAAKGRQPLCGAAEGRPHDFAVHFYELLLFLPCLHLEPNLTFILCLDFHVLLDSTSSPALKHVSASSSDSGVLMK